MSEQTNVKHYHVVNNTPGYMPDSEPYVVASEDEAINGTIADVMFWLDDSEIKYSVSGIARPYRYKTDENLRKALRRSLRENGYLFLTDNDREHDLGQIFDYTECGQEDCESELESVY